MKEGQRYINLNPGRIFLFSSHPKREIITLAPIQMTQNERNKLNPGAIASYDLRPGNGVVTILLEREGVDKKENR